MITKVLLGCMRLLSRFINAARLAGLTNHQRNVRKSRRVLRAVRRFSGAGPGWALPELSAPGRPFGFRRSCHVGTGRCWAVGSSQPELHR